MSQAAQESWGKGGEEGRGGEHRSKMFMDAFIPIIPSNVQRPNRLSTHANSADQRGPRRSNAGHTM